MNHVTQCQIPAALSTLLASAACQPTVHTDARGAVVLTVGDRQWRAVPRTAAGESTATLDGAVMPVSAVCDTFEELPPAVAAAPAAAAAPGADAAEMTREHVHELLEEDRARAWTLAGLCAALPGHASPHVVAALKQIATLDRATSTFTLRKRDRMLLQAPATAAAAAPSGGSHHQDYVGVGGDGMGGRDSDGDDDDDAEAIDVEAAAAADAERARQEDDARNAVAQKARKLPVQLSEVRVAEASWSEAVEQIAAAEQLVAATVGAAAVAMPATAADYRKQAAGYAARQQTLTAVIDAMIAFETRARRGREWMRSKEGLALPCAAVRAAMAAWFDAQQPRAAALDAWAAAEHGRLQDWVWSLAAFRDLCAAGVLTA
jgi:hypothetical protein